MSLPTPTYSVGLGAVKLAHQSVLKEYTIPDSDGGGNPCTSTGGMQQTMSQGDVILVKKPDGSLELCRFDPEHWTPTNPVLIKA
jgi:hypothetical protein